MTQRKNPPLLVCSPLTDRVYIVTRYTQDSDGRIKASVKYDVTNEFIRIELKRRGALVDALALSKDEKK